MDVINYDLEKMIEYDVEQKKDDYNLVKDKISLKKPIKQIKDYLRL